MGRYIGNLHHILRHLNKKCRCLTFLLPHSYLRSFPKLRVLGKVLLHRTIGVMMGWNSANCFKNYSWIQGDHIVEWKRLSIHVPPAFPKLYSPFAPKSVFCYGLRDAHQSNMWCHDVILWHRMKSHQRPELFHMGIPFRQKPWNHIFWPCDLDLWHDLDLQSQPS